MFRDQILRITVLKCYYSNSIVLLFFGGGFGFYGGIVVLEGFSIFKSYLMKGIFLSVGLSAWFI